MRYRVHGTGHSVTVVGLRSSQEHKRSKIARETETVGEGGVMLDATLSDDSTLSLVSKGR